MKEKMVIDATGLILTPGFIDFLAHEQNLPADRMQAFDGVTKALKLESGILPVAVWYDIQQKTGRVLNYDPRKNFVVIMKDGMIYRNTLR